MSPHNNARFNGTGVNSPHSYHNGQNELGLAMERLLNKIYKGLSIITGIHFFNNSRLFKRGVPKLNTISSYRDPR